MSIVSEFKEFAVKGNVLDMAVGLIIGAEFGKIVNSLVKDVLMPPVGMLMGGVDFSNLFLILREGPTTPAPYATLADAEAAAAITVNFGLFITSLISFIVMAFVVFLIVRAFNKVRMKPIA